MPIHSQSLKNLLTKISDLGAKASLRDRQLMIVPTDKKLDLENMLPFLYLLLNRFEAKYFIVILGMPYCVMPDASGHISFLKVDRNAYNKSPVCLGCRHDRQCAGWPRALKNRRPKQVRDVPAEVVFELTKKCNQDCPICFSGKNDKRDVPFVDVRSIIDECVCLGVRSVRFTGGEPLLYKDLGKALRYAKSKNLYVLLNSNLTIFDTVIREMFSRYVDNILISLQGFNAASERSLTRSSADFGGKLKSIASLNSVLPTVRLGTVISKTLINNLSKYLRIIKKLNIRHWELYRPMAKDSGDEFNLCAADLRALMKALYSNKRDGLDLKIANPVPFCLAGDFNLSSSVLLGAEADDGHSRLVFDARGFFKPSYFINVRLGKDIKKAWQSPFLKKIRSLDYLPKKCHSCFYLKWCKGGSRFWAHEARHSYFSGDPLFHD